MQSLRDGPVVAKLWREETQDKRAFVGVTIGRTYKDEKTGQYGEARSFSGANILRAQALLGEAHKEARNWERHFREIEQLRGAPEPEKSDALAARDAGLQAQKNAAMAQAVPPQQTKGRQRSQER